MSSIRKRGKLLSVSQEMKDYLATIDENPDIAIEKLKDKAGAGSCKQQCQFDASMIKDAVEDGLYKLKTGRL